MEAVAFTIRNKIFCLLVLFRNRCECWNDVRWRRILLDCCAIRLIILAKKQVELLVLVIANYCWC